MAKVTVDADKVDIQLSLADEVLSLHGAFHIPLSHIVSVSTEPVPHQWLRGIKIGANLPGIKVAATYITPEGVIFYDYRNADRCLTLALNHERYARVVVEVDAGQDLKALATEIQGRIGGGV